MSFESRLLGLRPGEEGATRRLLAVYFFTSAAACVSLSAGESIFLRNFPATAIPIAFLITSLVTLGVSPLLSSLSARFGASWLTLGLQSLLAAGFAGLSLLIFTEGPGVFAGAAGFGLAYLSFAVLRTLSLGVAESALDVRQMKRIYPAVAAGGTFGFVAGGFGTPLLIQMLKGNAKSGGLFALVAALVLLTTLFSAWSFQKDARPAPPKSAAGAAPEEVKAVGPSFTLLVLIAFFVASSSFVVLHFDFIYLYKAKEYVKEHYPYDVNGQLTRIFGLVRGVSTGVTFLVQILLLPWLLRRFGPNRILPVYPILLVISCSLVGGAFTFGTALFGRIGYYITKEALFFPALQTSWSALPEEVRRKRGFFVFNGMNALGASLGALMLVLLVRSGLIDVGPSAWISTGVAVVLSVGSFFVARAYLQTLLQGLQERGGKSVDLLAAYQSMSAQGSRPFLMALLDRDDPGTVRLALEFLRRERDEETDKAMLRLLERPQGSGVLGGVLDYARGNPPAALFDKADLFLADAAVAGRFLALCETAGKTTGAAAQTAAAALGQATTDPRGEIRLAAALVLARLGGPEADANRALARRLFAEVDEEIPLTLAESDPAAHPELVRWIWERFAETESHPPVRTEREVRLAVLSGDDDLAALLFDSLPLEAEVGHALERVLPTVSHGTSARLERRLREHPALHDRERALFLSRLPALDADSIAFLRERLLSKWGGLRVRAAVAHRLALEAGRAPDGEVDLAVEETLLAETKAARRDVLRIHDTGLFAEHQDLLRPEFENRLALRVRLLADLAVLRQPGQSTATAAKGITERDARTRIASLEAIETILPRKIADLLLPVLERDDDRIAREDRLQDDEAARRADLAMTFSRSDSPWERALGYELCRVAGAPAPEWTEIGRIGHPARELLEDLRTRAAASGSV